MGGSSKTTNSSATTQTNPWESTIPTLNNLIGQVGNQSNFTSVTPTENNAFAGLTANALAGNPYASQIGNVANTLLNGGGPDRSGPATDAYSSLQNSLNPIANQSTNPYDNQAFNQLRGTMTNDITDQIKSQYAGAGYSPVSSGDYAQQLGRGISQGIAPTFLQAQDTLTNQRMGAANSLNQGGANLSGILSGLDQTKLGNQQAGIGASVAALQARDSPYNQLLNIGQQQRNLPVQNIGNLESLLVPMAQLGGTSNSQGTATQTSNPGLLGTAMGIGSLFSGGAGSAWGGMTGAAGQGLGLLGSLFGGR